MDAPRRPLEEARRGLERAARGLEALRLAAGLEENSDASSPPAAGLRAALEQSRRALEERGRDLEAARARIKELESALSAPAAAAAPDTDAALRAVRAEEELRRARASLAQENASLAGRASLLQAELVRLEALRRKAEEATQEAERGRRGVEETLRRELRDAHAAVDRAAVDAGAREARAQAEVQAVQRRLEAALNRLRQLERERLAGALQRAAAVNASLRRELKDSAAEADSRERLLAARLEALERRASGPDTPSA